MVCVPSDPSIICTLPAQISAATRPYHTSLNRSITARLPLCLPPCATRPTAYYAGIAVFAKLYFTFEREWTNVLDSPGQVSHAETRIRSILRRLNVSSIQRSERLQADLSRLRQRLTDTSDPKGLASPMEEEITRSIRSKPHKLVAYSWILYMALFNGGRWIRGQLQSAGPEFWASTVEGPTIDCLSFWDFDGKEDGENIKQDFKRRIEEISGLLSVQEQADVVSEAVQIFQMCQNLVEHLDAFVQPNKASRLSAQSTVDAGSPLHFQGIWSWIWNLEGLWNNRLFGNDFWLRREVHVHP